MRSFLPRGIDQIRSDCSGNFEEVDVARALWFNDSGSPRINMGELPGDFYFNSDSRDCYERTGTTWQPLGRIGGSSSSDGAPDFYWKPSGGQTVSVDPFGQWLSVDTVMFPPGQWFVLVRFGVMLQATMLGDRTGKVNGQVGVQKLPLSGSFYAIADLNIHAADGAPGSSFPVSLHFVIGVPEGGSLQLSARKTEQQGLIRISGIEWNAVRVGHIGLLSGP
jgi:hypothetical protein